MEGWCGGRFDEDGDSKIVDGTDNRGREFYGRARLTLGCGFTDGHDTNEILNLSTNRIKTDRNPFRNLDGQVSGRVDTVLFHVCSIMSSK